MNEMSQLTITIPEDIVLAVREGTASGAYESESAVVVAAVAKLFDLDDSPHEGDPAFEGWLHTEVLASIDEYRADPSSGFTLDQMRAEVAKWHEEFAAETHT